MFIPRESLPCNRPAPPPAGGRLKIHLGDGVPADRPVLLVPPADNAQARRDGEGLADFLFNRAASGFTRPLLAVLLAKYISLFGLGDLTAPEILKWLRR